MSVNFNDEQLAIADTAERFARMELAPHYMAGDGTTTLDRKTVRQMGELGLIGSDLPSRYGGLDAGCVTAGIVTEAIAYADINACYIPLLNGLAGHVLSDHASEALASDLVPRIISGELLVALGLTEPRGGSDAANLQLKAVRDGDQFRLTGEKTSISFATQADAIILFARTGREGAGGVSAFYVELEQPGISRSGFNDVGSHTVGRGSIRFDDVPVPAAHMIGDEGMGFKQVMQGFDYSRAIIGLQCLAPARASLDETWTYVSQREAFDTPLAQFQGVSFPLAEAETQYEAARLLCYRALELRDQGKPHTSEAAMCKWWAPKLAHEIIQQCLLSHGHAGYSMDLPFQQRMRDVFGFQIGDGTAQIMKLIIARTKAGPVAVQYKKT
ncbi:MAG: acyl-CoA dehydrogenase family protein [Pseudomonadota bacterium]